MLTIGIYARKSVYRDNSDSVQVQIKSCKDYARLLYHDKELTFKVYDRDEGFSGKNTNRPSFQSLMHDVRSGLLDVVMVYKLDRISRSVKDFSDTYEEMYSHDVAFLSVKETFDTSTPIGRTVMYILAAFAQLERENTSERVSDSMAALGASGKWTGGRLPAGMTSVRKKIGEKEHSYLLVDEERIHFVKMIYRLFLEGNSITKLERTFREKGIKTERGKFLSTSQIYQILSNPVYCSNDPEAYYYFKDKDCTLPDERLFDGTKGLIGYSKTTQSIKTKRNASWTIAIGIHEPVIPASDWIKVQKRFGTNKMFRGNKYEIGILKGVLRCSCGARMDIRNYVKNGVTFSYYYCSAMARKGKEYCNTGYTSVYMIDNLFLEALKEIRLNPDRITLQNEVGPSVNTDILQRNIKKLSDSIDNLTSALMDNMESSASSYIIAKIEKLDVEKRQQENQLAAAEQNNRLASAAAETKDVVYYSICFLLDNLEVLPYQEKNELIRKTVTSCVLENNELKIMF